ncbi:uncharacterized protein BO72DRAFT_302795 [Aspergillus fijiensis CBS 313.89]|uniref:Uncharacterized protein n=1 Tax=Aspergillus fijiensis CBS 313.89 TaxID=1448319 RepID=A0A8G1W263_9EURO|nr:uncharacterized protein BO72DRAFT_302795 [Aspergillus fijiensis CBS 313.89]RAK80358.1 hypothetical protein BO72DRAFT_302795 [Aspergillus fijiensis CBS 313.89]
MNITPVASLCNHTRADGITCSRWFPAAAERRARRPLSLPPHLTNNTPYPKRWHPINLPSRRPPSPRGCCAPTQPLCPATPSPHSTPRSTGRCRNAPRQTSRFEPPSPPLALA